MAYDVAHSTYNGYKVFRSASNNDAYKLTGLRNTIIYLTYHAYLGLSYEFKRTCIERNIEVRVLT